MLRQNARPRRKDQQRMPPAQQPPQFPAPAQSLETAIVQEALQLGFIRVGFVPVEPLNQAGEALTRWLDNRYHGNMGYLAGAERSSPASLLPEARTLIVVALPHGRPTEPRRQLPLVGQVASYAQGGDYHFVLKEKLRTLAVRCSELSGCEVISRPCVDTAPLLEREVARRGGLGFTAKSTMTIIPGVGTHVLLGELLVDLNLTPTAAPVSQGCGKCTACLDACPTRAFVDAYTLDARRCISYLTIELQGTIPRELRTGIGSWVFGCDICQDVCPFNHSRRQKPCAPELKAQSGYDALDLIKLLTLTSSGYRRLVKGNAMRRVSRPRLQRNAAVALGNSKEEQAVAPLISTLTTSRWPLVRSHCAWALGELQFPSALSGLTRAHSMETNGEVLEEIEFSLSRYNSDT